MYDGGATVGGSQTNGFTFEPVLVTAWRFGAPVGGQLQSPKLTFVVEPVATTAAMILGVVDE